MNRVWWVSSGLYIYMGGDAAVACLAKTVSDLGGPVGSKQTKTEATTWSRLSYLLNSPLPTRLTRNMPGSDNFLPPPFCVKLPLSLAGIQAQVGCLLHIMKASDVDQEPSWHFLVTGPAQSEIDVRLMMIKGQLMMVWTGGSNQTSRALIFLTYS